jgi:hypothetical protein
MEEIMSQNNPGSPVSPKGGMLQDFFLRIRLILRLMADPRVNFLYKLIPVGSLLYLFFPDILIGPVDDAAVLWAGTSLFVQLCPPHVVEEHLAQLTGRVPASTGAASAWDENVIEGEWREKA